MPEQIYIYQLEELHGYVPHFLRFAATFWELQAMVFIKKKTKKPKKR